MKINGDENDKENPLIEELASIGHDQWRDWVTETIRDFNKWFEDRGLTNNNKSSSNDGVLIDNNEASIEKFLEYLLTLHNRWESKDIPYVDLDENDKEVNRKYADRILNIVIDKLDYIIDETIEEISEKMNSGEIKTDNEFKEKIYHNGFLLTIMEEVKVKLINELKLTKELKGDLKK